MGLIDQDLLRKGGGGGVSCLIATIKVTSDDDEDKRKREKNKCTKTIVVNAFSNADSLSKLIENDLVGSVLDEEESGKRT